MNMKKADKKVVIIGNSGVGKTSLIRRYMNGEFDIGNPNTIGAAFFLKQWNNKNIALWDTAGQEEYSGLTSFYCRKANAVILCYSVCDRHSFDMLFEKHSRLLETVGENCVMVFVGTKLDLISKKDNDNVLERKVTLEEAIGKSAEYSAHWKSLQHPKGILPIFETSAKTDTCVCDVFEYIFETLVPSEISTELLQAPASPSGLIVHNVSEPQKEPGKKCC